MEVFVKGDDKYERLPAELSYFVSIISLVWELALEKTYMNLSASSAAEEAVEMWSRLQRLVSV